MYCDRYITNIYPLCAAVYSEKPLDYAKTIDEKAEKVQQVTVICDEAGNTCSGYTGILPTKAAIIIGFRWRVADTGQVATYFYNAFYKIWNSGMGGNVSDLVKKHLKYDIWITGHSLGGALATLAASYVVETKLAVGDRIKLMTFGQPKPGDDNFANLLNKKLMTFGQPKPGDDNFANLLNRKIKYTFRVVNHGDPVVRIPLIWYKHQNTKVYYYESIMQANKYYVCDGRRTGLN
ncbi:unnamed protein product [Strongylus vulgaris]|uniref:Fungal lipase-type domain-containing protein n=1 Tax=Strongylus vulgaris TaxID=40348 RepID=A0A3P7IY49_STRVU|nr:unnamed protein product [Strongylus vulgaris]